MAFSKIGVMMATIGIEAKTINEYIQLMENMVTTAKTSSKAAQRTLFKDQERISPMEEVSDCMRAMSHPLEFLSK